MTSCSTLHENSSKVGNLIGGVLVDIDVTKLDSFFVYGYYVFFEYDDFNYVYFSRAPSKSPQILYSYEKKEVVDEDFEKIKVGMEVQEVVEIVGLPFDSYTSGVSSLAFKTTSGNIYSIGFYWSHERTGVLEVSDSEPMKHY